MPSRPLFTPERFNFNILFYNALNYNTSLKTLWIFDNSKKSILTKNLYPLTNILCNKTNLETLNFVFDTILFFVDEV